MSKRTLAIVAALALTAANVTASDAASLRLKAREAGGVQPVAGQLKANGATSQGAAQHNAAGSFKDHFNPNCVPGFQKFDQNWSGTGANKKIQSFSCRTGWIECPDFPGYTNVGLNVKPEYQGDPDLGGKVRIVYECYGWNPAG